MSSMFGSIPGLEAGLAALVGMIPNCAASVLITQLYISGLLDSGAMFAGLLCGPVPDFLYSFGKILIRRRICVCSESACISGVAAGLLLVMLM